MTNPMEMINGELVEMSDAEYASFQAMQNAASSASAVPQAIAAALAAGIVITSTGNQALNGTYPIDPATQVKLNSAITYIMLNSAFPPASASSMVWYDVSGNAHTFTSVAQFKAFATAFADFVAHVDIYASSGGQAGSIPVNTITIP